MSTNFIMNILIISIERNSIEDFNVLGSISIILYKIHIFCKFMKNIIDILNIFLFDESIVYNL